MALEQVSESSAGWRSTARPAFERVQNCQSDDPGENHSGGIKESVPWIWVAAVRGGRRRPCRDASEDGCGDGALHYGDSRDSAEGSQRSSGNAGGATALADDHSADTEGLDVSEGD